MFPFFSVSQSRWRDIKLHVFWSQNVFIPSTTCQASDIQPKIMQSFFQYRKLGRRLREEHKFNKVSALSSRADSCLSSVIDFQYTIDTDIEKAQNHNNPSQLSPSQPQSIAITSNDAVSSDDILARFDTSVANYTDGVDVREDSTKGKGEKIFVVVPDMDQEMNPRKWAKSIRLWATWVCSWFDISLSGVMLRKINEQISHLFTRFDCRYSLLNRFRSVEPC